MSLSVQGLIDSIVGYLTVIDRDNLYGLIVRFAFNYDAYTCYMKG